MRCLLFVVLCSSFARCLRCADCGLLLGVRCDYCLLGDVCCLLIVACCWLFVARCVLCGFWLDVNGLLLVVRCL